MLMVTLGLAASGNNSTRKPLGNAYSVTPPSEAFFCTPAGSVCAVTSPAPRQSVASIDNCGIRLIVLSVISLRGLHHARDARLLCAMLADLPRPGGEGACSRGIRWTDETSGPEVSPG